MVAAPNSLDVVVASDLFGDVLTDLAAALSGETEAAEAVIAAIESARLDGIRRRDVGGSATTDQVGEVIAQRVAR